MYYIANLETQKILTHRDGARMVRASEDVAKQDAAWAQELSGHPHGIVPLGTNSSALGREVAPWLEG